MQSERKYGLRDERESWRDRFDRGYKPFLLGEYVQNRESELWRSTRIMEQLCEYILWLEDKINCE